MNILKGIARHNEANSNSGKHRYSRIAALINECANVMPINKGQHYHGRQLRIALTHIRSKNGLLFERFSVSHLCESEANMDEKRGKMNPSSSLCQIQSWRKMLQNLMPCCRESTNPMECCHLHSLSSVSSKFHL